MTAALIKLIFPAALAAFIIVQGVELILPTADRVAAAMNTGHAAHRAHK
jgi:hypothetical protein